MKLSQTMESLFELLGRARSHYPTKAPAPGPSVRMKGKPLRSFNDTLEAAIDSFVGARGNEASSC